MTVLIRKMEERDLTRCSEINYYAWTVDFKEFETVVPTGFKTVPEHALVAIKDDNVIGYISWYFDNQGVFIQMLYVDKSHRRAGVGRMLMDEMLTNVSSQRIRLYSHIKNQDAVKFYQKYGFENVKELVFKDMPVYEMLLSKI